MPGNQTMGRKKSDPPNSPPRPHAVVVKGTLDWKRWVEEGAEFARLTVAGLVDASLIDYLKAKGFDKPPPPR